jgi:hypothetical protein
MLNQELEQDTYTTALENVLIELLESFDNEAGVWVFHGYDDSGYLDDSEVDEALAMTLEHAEKILATHDEDPEC